MVRGFNVWRSHPKWYMHCSLRLDCKARGGCCGRDCGCCSDHINKPGSPGHCTVDCYCCEQARGFYLDGPDRWELQTSFDFGSDDPNRSSYVFRIAQVSFLGLLTGSDRDPFELIDEEFRRSVPPQRGNLYMQQSGQKRRKDQIRQYIHPSLGGYVMFYLLFWLLVLIVLSLFILLF